MKQLIIIAFSFFLFGCSVHDYASITRVVVSKDPSAALEGLARQKGVQYASNPKKLSSDLEYLDKNIQKVFAGFIAAIAKEWGENNVKFPKKQETVKYLQNYKSRALIDFDKGIVTVETLDEKNPLKSLEDAIVTTLLLPEDPRAADLFSAKEVKLGATPYLLGEVRDDQNKNIRYVWRATRYAKILIKNNYTKYRVKNKEKYTNIHKVSIPMEKDHASTRVAKFTHLVERYAQRFKISKNLVYAIIRTESNFNQFAVSKAGAYGLMQIVPRSAGRDAYKRVKGKDWQPSKSYLFDAKNNIELGVAYLDILQRNYLAKVQNPISKEYCVIAAYNTGSGNVLRTFSPNRENAFSVINKMTPQSVYEKLREEMPYMEARRYLYKVINFKKDFVNL